MPNVVADTSAILAILFSEPGADHARQLIANGSLTTSVNYSEMLSKYEEQAGGFDDGKRLTRALFSSIGIVIFDIDLAERAAALRAPTRALGLSLGDRACLALAQRERLPVITAERIWTKLDLGITIELIR